eukprot:Gb_19795 [translate_table: standard]
MLAPVLYFVNRWPLTPVSVGELNYKTLKLYTYSTWLDYNSNTIDELFRFLVVVSLKWTLNPTVTSSLGQQLLFFSFINTSKHTIGDLAVGVYLAVGAISHESWIISPVVELLGKKPEHLSVLESSKRDLYTSEVDLRAEVQSLIRDLVMHIHEQEAEIEKSILVFLPTYRLLEQQWLLLKRSQMCLKIYVLHSSIDIEQATRAMQISHSHRKDVGA